MRRAQTNNATDNECIERVAERPVAEIVAQPGHLDEQFLPRTEPEVRLQSVDVVEQEAGEVRRPNRMLETPMRRARKHVIRRAHLRQVTKTLELQRIDHVDQLGIDINQAWRKCLRTGAPKVRQGARPTMDRIHDLLRIPGLVQRRHVAVLTDSRRPGRPCPARSGRTPQSARSVPDIFVTEATDTVAQELQHERRSTTS